LGKKSELPLLIDWNVLLLCVAERPNFIALDAPARQISQRMILVLLTDRSQSGQETLNGILGDSGHPHSGADGISFY
jgi:hypothetical protein